MHEHPWNIPAHGKLGSEEVESAVHSRDTLNTTKRPGQ